MKKTNIFDLKDIFLFGIFKDSALSDENNQDDNDSFEEYKNYKNTIPKDKIINHILYKVIK